MKYSQESKYLYRNFITKFPNDPPFPMKVLDINMLSFKYDQFKDTKALYLLQQQSFLGGYYDSLKV